MIYFIYIMNNTIQMYGINKYLMDFNVSNCCRENF